ncbi:MAG: hypothetical protein IPL71_03940 [Anaerolineales bacterium]|uniref:hypothetical protein n=1 Tax=Candidatus Villigracilis proximus TaxID=3140683 RepID=UPI00313653BB|nr:hypothetical protein [Anaerolineales bacterium]
MISITLGQTLFYFSHTIMSKHRVLLICSQPLRRKPGDDFAHRKDIELIGLWKLGDMDICERLLEAKPSVVVIADENLQNETADELTRSIIEQYSELSVIRTGLSENVFRIVSTHTLPARGDNLLETIRNSANRTQEANGSKSKNS